MSQSYYALLYIDVAQSIRSSLWPSVSFGIKCNTPNVQIPLISQFLQPQPLNIKAELFFSCSLKKTVSSLFIKFHCFVSSVTMSLLSFISTIAFFFLLSPEVKVQSSSSNVTSFLRESRPSIATTQGGVSVPSLSASLTVGPRGPVLLQDVFLIDKLAHFNRERNPERVVHAKGAGAAGHFTVTHDLSDITRAGFLRGVGKTTRTLVRFSTVGGERGSADTAIDPKGFAGFQILNTIKNYF